MARLRTLHRRKRRKSGGPSLPPTDFRRFTLCNRFAASAEGRALVVGERDGLYRFSRAVYFPDAFYSLKDRIVHRFGKPAGLALQHWTSFAFDYSDYDGGMKDGCDHYHILERTRLKGRIYHKPTGHFYWSNNLSEDYKQTVGFDAMKKQCVERLEGKKRVTRAVPEKATALRALATLRKRYGRLPERPREPKPPVYAGNWYGEMISREAAREREERAKRRVQCHYCLQTFGGLEVENIDGHDFCNACRSVAFKGREVMEEIPF